MRKVYSLADVRLCKRSFPETDAVGLWSYVYILLVLCFVSLLLVHRDIWPISTDHFALTATKPRALI